MLDTPIGQEILQMGVKEGIRKGLYKGAQHILLKQVATQFGKVPEDIRRKIIAVKDLKELDRLAAAFLNARSLAELKKAF